jgi:lipooligosaccharide transport system ATP-binding protein
MRMLTGQTRPTSGSIAVLDYDIATQSKQVRARMGVVPQIDNLDTELTAEQNLTMFAALYRVPRRERPAAVERALDIAQLRERRASKVSELSGGMKRRLLIARGLVHEPELVLLDEPTVGLDPQVRQELWSLIDALRSQGTTILMSTHYIEEAERLADDVAVVSHGQIVARGTPHTLREQHVGSRATEFYGSPTRLAELERIAQDAGLATRRTGPSITVLRSEDAEGELLESLGDGVHRKATLEDVFVLLTGEVLK